MAVLMPEGPGALLTTVGEDKPRIRVRLHFGGDFAQEGPRQWRYVGGEVYNESFPVDSKYAEVMKRLNDKFGDTVSFKYLCPGDDMDPDNLVQVQGDDDLREMCVEYQNALQKTSTPVNTVRIKVFVYRAVIFEQEVQELDEELGEDDELMTHGGEDELLSSCDPVDCGPNWSDWGDPDEQYVTHSSVRSVQFSSDAEQHASIAPAAVMALPYITSMSVNSITSAPAYFSVPPAPLTSAGGMGGAGSKASPQWLPQLKQPPPGALAHPLLQPKRLSGHGASGEENYDAIDNCGGSSSSGGHVGSSRPHHRGGQVTAAAAAVLVADSLALGEEAGAYVPSGLNVLAELSYARRYGAEGTFMDTEQLEQSGEQLYYDAIVLEDRGEEVATAEKAGGTEGEEQEEGVWVQPEDPYNLVCQPLSQEQQWSLHKEPPGYNWTEAQGEARDPVQGGWRHDCECGLEWSRLEQQQTQERQTQEQQERRLEQQQQMQTQTQERLNLGQDDQHRAVCLPPGVGFYSDGELEDPYFNASSADAPDLRLLCVTDAGRVQNRSSAASDGVLRVIPRAEDVAAYGEQAEGHLGPNGVRAAGTGALLDLLPRHISAFGDSSRDDIKSGGGPLLPSRITIFGDDGSLNGTPGSGGGSLIGVGGRHGFGELHRLALSGGRLGAAAARWPYPRVNADDAVIVGPCDVDAGTLGRVADDLMKSVTTFFYTQEMQPTSTQEPGTHGSGGEEKMCGGRGGRPGKPLGMGDSLSRPNGPEIDLGGVDRISSATGHSHLLKGVVKKRKSEVSILAKIGEGAFGEVSQAQVFPYGIVAVKWLKRERFAKYSESFQREAETLAKLNHPNIIRMFGLVMDTPDSPSSGGASSGGGGVSGRGAGQAAHGGSGGGSGGNNNHGGGSSPSGAVTPTGPIGGIITEFVRNGSLGQYLRSLNGKRLSLRQRAMIALQAALGMAYLHEQSPAVVHFDLKPDNLLVDGEGDSMVIKVADFGLSKHKLSNYVSCRDLRGTLPYMAYELVSGNDNVSEKVDVYSMGVVMWEMYTGEVPFAHLTAQEILTGLLHGNLHLAIPPACEPEWRSLVETCMDPNPANRPSFQELVMQLQEILRLERQASNASSAAAAAAAAVLDSDTSVAGKQPSDNTVGWRLPAAGPGLAQVRSPRAGPPVPQPPPVQAAQALLARQQAQMQAAAAAAAAAQQQQRPLSPQPPQQQQHPPLLAPLQQQHAPPLPQHHAPPFQVQHQYGNLQFALPPAAARQNPTQAQLPQQQPVPPQHPPPQQQHIHYLPQLAPGLILQQPQQQHIPVPPAHLYQLPLRPQPLFQPPPQQHGQHLNGLYGMVGGGGVSGGGLPALVSWSDRI
ncbi:hypothetical protein Vretifemale_12455 [Volvox reticuliferus]|uniref:Protein kinase domain-containing protein n=1 Tax=Volvox reticuliferus TaxID=1737510 RepID=A0A8J4CNZ4_9CHLO|nr:hypothetical protein Vretifemale_12455 [Volvox reticuliferus]